MDELNVLNIPAFKRKRSINARGNRPPSYATIKPSKPARTTRIRRTRTKLEEKLIDIPASSNSYSNSYPSYSQPLPSQEIFPSPIMDEEPSYSSSSQKSSFREMKIIGRCEGYFDKIEVAVIQLTSSLRVGDSIIFETNEGLFEQEVASMQIDRKDISLAHAGDDIGLKVLLTPKVGGSVYKVL